MIKILEKSKYDKMQYDKLFSFSYHIQCSKYDKNINQCSVVRFSTLGSVL